MDFKLKKSHFKLYSHTVSFAMLTIDFKIIMLKHLVIFVLFTKEARKNF
jgi:hypothetical protein